MATPPIEAVNFHLWQPCNMHCKFCFATFQDVKREVLPAGHLNRNDAERLILLLARAGFLKITFAGGEPLLCPWIGDLVKLAKGSGLVTCIVSNGSLLSEEFLQEMSGCLDWLTLSIDSLASATLFETGRYTRGQPMLEDALEELCAKVTSASVRLRINTVVTRANLREDLSEFIVRMKPERWKILQALPIAGQNSGRIDPFLITLEEFDDFVKRNAPAAVGGRISVVAEANADMIGSYAMIDPAGRFFDNLNDGYTYSRSILSVGVHEALDDVRIIRQKYVSRGGEFFLKDAKSQPIEPPINLRGWDRTHSVAVDPDL